MSNETFKGLCPIPFLQETLFPSSGGDLDGRYCAHFPTPDGPTSCCLPCPTNIWRFKNSENTFKIANWLGVAVLPLPIFVLVTYLALPVKWTNCTRFGAFLTLACLLMQLAFVIPLGNEEKQCHNEITPNDINSDLTCAFSGSLTAFSGCCLAVWSFIRSALFHIQVCWEISLGRKSTWAAVVCGWAIIVAITTVALCLSGVSYRYGITCTIGNNEYGKSAFWLPLIVITGVTLVLQFATVAYCMRVYLKSLCRNSNALRPACSNSSRGVSKRKAYGRVREVLWLQWRGICLTLAVLFHIVFVGVVNQLSRSYGIDVGESKKAQDWVTCLAESGGNKQQCLHLARGLGPSESLIAAPLCLLAIVGLWNAIILVRPSMFHGWVDLFKRWFPRRDNFVSVESLIASQPYEKTQSSILWRPRSSESELQRPDSARVQDTGHRSRSPGLDGLYFAQSRSFSQPFMSFSAPRSPQPWQARDWDPEATYAPSCR